MLSFARASISSEHGPDESCDPDQSSLGVSRLTRTGADPCQQCSERALGHGPHTTGVRSKVRVYQFLSAADGLTVLRTQRLRVSRLDRLNDPFEFLGANLSDPGHRQVLRSTKAELAKTKGLLCFSKTWRNPVLWGHYADKHRGLCLGFEIAKKHVRRVDYVKSRFSWPEHLSIAFMKKILFSKFSHWSYEQEYRSWVSLDDNVKGHFYVPFSSELELKEVFVGAESTLTRAQIAKALGALVGSIEVTKVRAAFNTFQIVENLDASSWT